MSRILVTGGLGFLGQHLVQALLNKNESAEIWILARSPAPIFLEALHDRRVKVFYNVDLLNAASLIPYFSNVDYVFHTAALISFWHKDRARLTATNVLGTRQVVALCLKYGIQRLVHVSSTATLRGSPDASKAADETSPYDWETKSAYDYGLSKYHAEQEVVQGLTQGLPAVIANPCSILGYGDSKIFPLIETATRQAPFCFSGGSHLIDVRDLAEGLSRVLTHGRNGERYLLVGTFHTQLEIMTSLARLLSVRPPAWVLPGRLLGVTLPFLAITDALARHKPALTRTMVMNGLVPVFFSNRKAGQDLAWTPRHTLDESLAEAIRYYKERQS